MTEKVALGGNFLLLLLLEQEENYDSSSSHSAEEVSELSDDISTITIVEPILLVPQRRPPISDERVSNHFKTEYLFVRKVNSAIYFINIL